MTEPVERGAIGAPASDGAANRERVWPRALALFALVTGMTVVSPSVLVGVPLVLLVLGLPTRRLGALVAGGLSALFAFQGVARGGLWYAERGWAILVGGWFVAVTLRWPNSRFTSRALGAVGGATAATAAFLVADPSRWAVLDWLMGQKIRAEIVAGLALLRGADEPLPEALASSVYGMAESQVLVFPAVLALASVAGLGVAWWAHHSLTRGRDGGLGPIRLFDFDDRLVWLLIGGLALILIGGGGAWGRAGWNAVIFMGGLYAVRGAGVAAFLTGGVSLFWGIALGVSLLFLWPFIVASAALVGLGDTWLRFRERSRELAA